MQAATVTAVGCHEELVARTRVGAEAPELTGGDATRAAARGTAVMPTARPMRAPVALSSAMRIRSSEVSNFCVAVRLPAAWVGLVSLGAADRPVAGQPAQPSPAWPDRRGWREHSASEVTIGRYSRPGPAAEDLSAEGAVDLVPLRDQRVDQKGTSFLQRSSHSRGGLHSRPMVAPSWRRV